MSKLEVDKIDPQSGTDLELGTSGDTITIPAGVTFDSSAATNTLPATVVTTDGTQTLTNKSIAATQLTGTVATSNLGTGTADATTFLRGDQTYASATPAAGSITTTQLAYNPNSFRNIIINGDMSIAQRATSQSSVTTTGYYTCDRFQWIADYGTVTLSQDTTVPSGQGFAKSYKVDVTTAGTVSSGGYVLVRQRIEGQNLQYLKKGTSNAESLTLSFWIQSTKTGTYIAELYDADNNRQISKAYTVSSSNTWEKKTLTFDGDTSGAFGNDNGGSLFLNLYLSAGTDYTSGTLNTSWAASVNVNRVVGQVDAQDSTSNNIYFTGVQLEAGTSASDFEFLPNDINKNRCYRYFQKLSVVLMNFNATGLLGFVFPVEMRANPSVSREYSGTANRMYNVGTAATADVVSPTTIVSNKTIRYWYAFSPASWATATRSGWETEYTLDSEL
jgi:hypothetical protein